MSVAELIKYLETLNQDYKITTSDSEYPNSDISEGSIEDIGNNTYLIY